MTSSGSYGFCLMGRGHCVCKLTRRFEGFFFCKRVKYTSVYFTQTECVVYCWEPYA